LQRYYSEETSIERKINQIEVVGGRFDPDRLRFPWKLIPALKHMPASDLRDWEAIRARANRMAAQLQPFLTQ
jgi:hypothetical protein